MPAIALFLLRGGILSVRPTHVLLLVPLLIGGGLQPLNALTALVDQRWLGPALVSPVLFVCLGLCLRQLGGYRSDTTEPV